ncbi:hypothetical protein R1sor_015387 [Riccia sorocarpa]|uniref:DUF676 domain-containing protein n=1 Tax=Riccia sorocarpa TaxID=122646 RepID=A0ABD3HCI7_9MARC
MSPQDNEDIERQATKFKRVNDQVYELLREENPDLEVVFVHGLHQQDMNTKHAFWRTWKMRASEECWPESLLPKLLQDTSTWPWCWNVTDREYKPRVLSVSYENKADLSPEGAGTETSDPYLIIENLIHDLIIDAGVGQNGVPVFFVGHDLGGILIKQFVLKVEVEAATADSTEKRAKLTNFLDNLKSVFFFCTPHYGARAFDDLVAKLQSKDVNQMLCLMTELYKETARINMEFGNVRRTRFSTHVFHAAFETHEGGFHAQVVPEGTARADADSFYTVGANHFTACQPECKMSSQVQKISSEMKSILRTVGPRGHAN